jgi:hypothetical protein
VPGGDIEGEEGVDVADLVVAGGDLKDGLEVEANVVEGEQLEGAEFRAVAEELGEIAVGGEEALPHEGADGAAARQVIAEIALGPAGRSVAGALDEAGRERGRRTMLAPPEGEAPIARDGLVSEPRLDEAGAGGGDGVGAAAFADEANPEGEEFARGLGGGAAAGVTVKEGAPVAAGVEPGVIVP